MVEHLPMQALQRFARVDAELIGQLSAQLVVPTERLGLPPAPVQGEHPPLVQLLTQRVLRDQLIQLTDHRGVVSGRELTVDLRLDRGEPLLGQPRRDRCHELEVGEVGQNLAAPQCESSAQLGVGSG